MKANQREGVIFAFGSLAIEYRQFALAGVAHVSATLICNTHERTLWKKSSAARRFERSFLPVRVEAFQTAGSHTCRLRRR